MKKALVPFAAGLSLLGFSIISCQKANSALNSTAVSTMTVAASAVTAHTQSVNDMSNVSESTISRPGSPATQVTRRKNGLQVDRSSHSSGGATVVFKEALGDSVTVVPQSSNSPGIMTSSFGAGVTLNGKIRKGIIVSHFINKYYEQGFSDTITFSHYSENGHSIGGTVILTRISDSQFTRISQLTFGSGGGAVSTYSSATTRTYNFGVNAPGFVIPAVYTFNETGVITSHNGSSGSQYTSTIITPLRYLVSAACTLATGVFPISGTVNLTSSAPKAAS